MFFTIHGFVGVPNCKSSHYTLLVSERNCWLSWSSVNSIFLFMVYVVYLMISQELTAYCQIIGLLNSGTVLEGIQQIMEQS